MEAPPGDNGAYEAPGSLKRIYRGAQRFLRRMSGVEVQHTSPPPAAKDTPKREYSVNAPENKLWLGDEIEIPDSVVDNKTWVIIGKKPDTSNPKYKKLPEEYHIELSPNIQGVPQRAVALKLNTDGSMLVMNTWDKDMTWGISEQQKLIIRPGQVYSIEATQNKANFRVDLPSGDKIRAQGVGARSGGPQILHSIAFSKT